MSKVVSTKLTEEEYGKLVGLCSATGFTVSKLLKRAILERMKEKPSNLERPMATKETKQGYSNEGKELGHSTPATEDDQFLYY